MTSKEVKDLMMAHYGWLDCVASAYELPNLNSADFIVVKYGNIIQEYEIKLTRSDLIGEMRCARVAKGFALDRDRASIAGRLGGLRSKRPKRSEA